MVTGRISKDKVSSTVLGLCALVALSGHLFLSSSCTNKTSNASFKNEAVDAGFSASQEDDSTYSVADLSDVPENGEPPSNRKLFEPLPLVSTVFTAKVLKSDSSIKNKIKMGRLGSEVRLSGKKVTDLGLKRVSRLKVKAIELDNTGVSPGGLTELKKCGSLEALTIALPELTDQDLGFLNSLKNLKSLSLRCPKISNQAVATLLDMPALERLDIAGTAIDDSGVEKLSGISRLKSLGLGGLSKVTGACLTSLAKMDNLENIDLSGIEFNKEQIVSFKRLKVLKVLNLGGCKLDSAMIQAVSEVTSLKYLNLAGISGKSKISDQDLRPINKLVDLVWVNLADKNTEDGSKLEFLESLTNLQYLNLSGAESGDEVCASIQSLTGLKQLVLERCKLTDNGLKKISGLVDLNYLDLSDNSDISDNGLSSIKEMKNLRTLRLDSNKLLSAASDEIFASLPSLSYLSFEGAMIHSGDLVLFDKANPDCKVFGLLPSREHLRKLAIDPFESWDGNFKAALSDISMQSYTVAYDKLKECLRDLDKVENTPAEEYGGRKIAFPNSRTLLTNYALSVVLDLQYKKKKSRLAYKKVLKQKLDSAQRENDTLAMVYHFLGEKEAAEKCYKNALASRDGDTFYIDNERLYKAYALLLDQTSRYVEAAKYEDKVYLHNIKAKAFDGERFDNLKEIDKVAKLLESCLILREKQVEDKQKLLRSMQLVAALYTGTDKASPLWKKCKSLSKLSSETDKISYAVTRLELGNSLMQDLAREGKTNGRDYEEKLVAEAIEEWQAAVVLADKLLGEQNGLSAQALHSEASCLLHSSSYQEGAIEEAVATSKRVLDLKKKLYGQSETLLACAKNLYDNCLKRSKSN